jgi:endoglucanase
VNRTHFDEEVATVFSQRRRGRDRWGVLSGLARLGLPAVAALAILPISAISQIPASTDQIRLNQLGFYPDGPKAAYVLGELGESFHVVRVGVGDTLFTGRLGPRMAAPASSDTTRLAEFSVVREPGVYELHVPALGSSHRFEIRPGVHEDLALAAMKGFYYQRASIALEPRYAGRWSRAAGHPDTVVLVHPSAATARRPAGTVISSPLGWYDAGDYNKYVVNSGITVGTLLSLYEDFPDYVRGMHLNIPESGDAVPDLLHEVLWNVRWMLTMQDSDDGGVYHKLTNARFDGYVMPADAQTEPRYVVQKSTAAALNLAATMAQASRILRGYERHFPGLADSALTAASRAWQWARLNPEVLFVQPRMNERFDPDIVTGAYGDGNVQDEFLWAAAELYVTTREDSFYIAVPLFPNDSVPVPTWNQVRALGYYTLARSEDPQQVFVGHHGSGGRLSWVPLPDRQARDRERIQRMLVRAADGLIERAGGSAYRTPMGGATSDYIWGSSAVAANQGIMLIQAYRLTGDPRHLEHALANLDYLLGRNATGFSFVTGYGGRPVTDPHHRPSIAHAVGQPVPGLLSGGPNFRMQDAGACTVPYPSTAPDKAFLDHYCSYASNEIAINWNSPLVYLAAAIEALQYDAGLSARRR